MRAVAPIPTLPGGHGHGWPPHMPFAHLHMPGRWRPAGGSARWRRDPAVPTSPGRRLMFR